MFLCVVIYKYTKVCISMGPKKLLRCYALFDSVGDTPLEKFEPHHEFLHKLDKAEQAGGLKVLKISNISYDSTRTPKNSLQYLAIVLKNNLQTKIKKPKICYCVDRRVY